MTDSDWLSLIKEDPKHGDVWQAYIEWLQDEKGDLHKTEAVRFVVSKSWFPRWSVSTAFYTDIDRSWDWRHDNFYGSKCCLPEEIYEKLEGGRTRGNGYPYCEYKSCEDALEGLFAALVININLTTWEQVL